MLKTIGQRRILYTIATEAEYGPHLKTRINPLLTGVGPIESGIALSAFLARLHGTDPLPDFVVALGSAGSNSLEQTGIYQASAISYRDMDASALGFEKGTTPFLDLPANVKAPLRIPSIASATLSTGGSVISGTDYHQINTDMVDMESFALMRAANMFAIPFITLRGISDGEHTVNTLTDWTQYLHIIDEKLAQSVDLLESAILRDQLVHL